MGHLGSMVSTWVHFVTVGILGGCLGQHKKFLFPVVTVSVAVQEMLVVAAVPDLDLASDYFHPDLHLSWELV